MSLLMVKVKATFWYTTRPKMEYFCGEQIVSTYEVVFFIRSMVRILVQNPSLSDQIGQYVMEFIEAVKNLVDENL